MVEERAICREKSTVDERATHDETPIRQERASVDEKPGIGKRATLDETPNERERAMPAEKSKHGERPGPMNHEARSITPYLYYTDYPRVMTPVESRPKCDDCGHGPAAPVHVKFLEPTLYPNLKAKPHSFVRSRVVA